jgi:hypothetical protein
MTGVPVDESCDTLLAIIFTEWGRYFYSGQQIFLQSGADIFTVVSRYFYRVGQIFLQWSADIFTEWGRHF